MPCVSVFCQRADAIISLSLPISFFYIPHTHIYTLSRALTFSLILSYVKQSVETTIGISNPISLDSNGRILSTTTQTNTMDMVVLKSNKFNDSIVGTYNHLFKKPLSSLVTDEALHHLQRVSLIATSNQSVSYTVTAYQLTLGQEP